MCASLRPTANSTLAAAIHGHIGRVLASAPFTISQSEGGGGAGLAIVNGIAQTCGVVKLSKKITRLEGWPETLRKTCCFKVDFVLYSLATFELILKST